MTEVIDDKYVKTRYYLWFIVLVAVSSYVFRDGLSTIVNSWSQDEYSHGYLIPPIAFLLMINTIIDKKIVFMPSIYGLLVIIFSILMFFVFEISGFVSIVPQTYVLCIVGIMVLFIGHGAIVTLICPVVLLFLAIPLPKFFYYDISTYMQEISTYIGTFIIEASGLVVFQDGNIIDLGGYKLNVVEACSGIRYLFPLLGVSLIIAFLFNASIIRRITMFLSAIPVAILLNGSRLGLIGITVDIWGPSMAEGIIHDAEGFIIFGVGVALMLLEVRLLSIGNVRSGVQYDRLRIPSIRQLPTGAVGKYTVIVSCVLLLSAVTSAFLPEILPKFLTPVYLSKGFENFPLRIGQWVGRSGMLDSRELKVLGTKDYLLADYASKNEAETVALYALYYSKQDSASNEAVHSPTVCIPSGGWTVDNVKRTSVPVLDPASEKGAQLLVNRMLITKGDTHEIVYYWYVLAGKSMTRPGEARLYTFLSSLRTGRTNGGLLRVITPVGRNETEKDADDRMNRFLRDSMPEIHAFMFDNH